MKPITVILRNSTWHIRRRVPKRFANVEKRTIVHVSLHTDSRSQAEKSASLVWDRMVDAWEAKLAGYDQQAIDRFEAARRLAQARGVRYMSAPEVALLPIEDILRRVEASVDHTGKVDLAEADAMLGLQTPPRLTVSAALEAFWEIAAEDLRGKNDDQIRRWRSPRIRATNNFLKVIGDKPLDEVTTHDLFSMRKWWVDRIMADEARADTANKDFTHLIGGWKRVARARDIKLGFSTEGLMLRTDKEKDDVRPPFERDWIEQRLLKPGALDGLNTDARLILIGMVNTGYRRPRARACCPRKST